LLFVPRSGHSQAASAKNQNTDKPAATKDQKGAALSGLTRVSTDEAARQASLERKPAKAVKESPAGSAKSKDSPDASTKPDVSPESDVLEFQPAAPNEKGATSAAVVDSKKSHAKDIHGSAYGSAGAGAHAEGGAVGATLERGKTSVYVETDRSRTSSPR
jgi:hypothetical protein